MKMRGLVAVWPRVALPTVLLLALALALALAGIAVVGVICWYYASVGWDDAMPTGLVDAAGQPAEYTLMFMSHAARRRTLRMSVEHYSKCPSGEAAGASAQRDPRMHCIYLHSRCHRLSTGWPPLPLLSLLRLRCAHSGGDCGGLERWPPAGHGV